METQPLNPQDTSKPKAPATQEKLPWSKPRIWRIGDGQDDTDGGKSFWTTEDPPQFPQTSGPS